MGTPIRVLLADDHRMIREGLRALLNGEPDLEVVGEAHDGEAAVAMANDLRPDVVVMDLQMPAVDGVEATRRIRAADENGPRVIALSAYGQERFVAQALKAGAAGFLLKTTHFDEIAHGVRAVAAGRVYLTPAVTGAVVEDYLRARDGSADADDPALSASLARLSPRERDVLRLIASGRSTKETAFDLRVSIKTVETHRRNLMEKLDRFSVAELTQFAIDDGLIPLEPATATTTGVPTDSPRYP